MKSLILLMVSITLFIGSPFTGWAQGKKEPYVIGVVNNSTGAMGMFGILQNNGIQLAADLINKAGGVDGHKIVPLIYDGETKPDVNLRMARKLIKQDKVKVLIGPNFTPGIGSIAPLVNEAKIPMPKFGGYIVDPAKDPYLFSFGGDNAVMALALVEHFRTKGIKRIAIAAVKSSYGEEFTDCYRKYVAKYPDMSIVGVEWFMLEDTDITPQITKLMALKPDVIAGLAGGSGTLLTIRTAYKLGFKGPFAATHADANRPYAESIKDMPTGYSINPARNTCIQVMVDTMPAGPRKALSLKVMSEWEKKFGSLKDVEMGAVGYDFVEILGQAFKAVGNDSEKIKKWLESTQILCLQGTLRMTPTDHMGGNPKEAVAILTTENGRFVAAK